jgi:ABC-2 type transport system permease protein
MMLSLSATLLPTVMLSGFIFPINSMPEILQYLSYLVPAKYYIMIIRGVMLKGNTLSQLILPAVFLLILMAAMLRNALRRFNLNLEK